MMRLFRYLACAVVLQAAAPLLAATSNIEGVRTKVVNGMKQFGGLLRSTIPVTAAPLPSMLHYAAGNNCTFEMVWGRTGASDLNGTMTLNTAKVRDRIAISINAVGAPTSLLISPDGAVTNLNSVDPFTHERTVSANLAAMAEKTRQRLREMYPAAQDADVLLGMPMLPELIANNGTVGSKVGVVRSLKGEWAAYYYQGMVQYKDWNGAVLDLIRVMNVNGKPTAVRIGFLVAEYRTMMPLIFVFENLDHMRARVERCDR